VCDRATLDLNLRHISGETASLNEQQTRQLREKDTELRKLKKATLQLKVARDGLELVEQTHENKKAEVSH